MKRKFFVLASAMMLSVFMLLGCGEKSVEDADFRFVKVEECDGELSLERNDKSMDVHEGMMLQPKDTMYTGDDSEAVLLVDSDKHITVTANTGLSINAKGDENDGKVMIELLYGDAMFVIDNKLNDDSTFEVVTPNATLSVRGTTFQVAYDKDTNTTYVEVAEGVVYADYEGDAEDEEIEAGQVRVINETEVYDHVDDSIWDFDFDLIEMANAYAATGDGLGNAFVPEGETAQGQYESVRANMEEYVAMQEGLLDYYDYGYDYMIFDYDDDGEKEVILYLRYSNEDRETILDLCYLDYTPDKGVYTYAIDTGNMDESCFYAEYNGKLVRYSWRFNPTESYIYSVYASDGTLMYVLEDAYDEVFSEVENHGLYPLALYGYWEMITNDMLL